MKILVRKWKKRKKVKKALGFIVKIVQTVPKPFVLYCFFVFFRSQKWKSKPRADEEDEESDRLAKASR